MRVLDRLACWVFGLFARDDRWDNLEAPADPLVSE